VAGRFAHIHASSAAVTEYDDSIFAIRAGTGAGPLKAPAAPKEFANVFSVGYRTLDHFPEDEAETDVRRPEQRGKVQAVCKKVQGGVLPDWVAATGTKR
jgi:hypothetical protein